MKKLITIGLVLAVFSHVALAVPNPALTIVSGGNISGGGPYNMGWQFTISTTIVITHLGRNECYSAGLNDPSPPRVSMWAEGNTTALFFATIPLATGVDNGFYYVALVPDPGNPTKYYLAPGTYRVAAQQFSNGEYYRYNAVVSTPSDIVMTGSVLVSTSDPSAYPSSFGATTYGNAHYFGGSFKYELPTGTLGIRTWNGGAAGDWSAGVNWGGTAPTIDHSAVINTAGAVVTANGTEADPSRATSLEVTLGSVLIPVGNKLVVTYHTKLYDGMDVQGTFATETFRVETGSTLNSSGTIQVLNIFSNGTANLNAGSTLTATGSLFVESGTVTLAGGTITAPNTSITGGTLNIGDGSTVNSAVVVNGGALNFTGGVDSSIIYSNAILRINSGTMSINAPLTLATLNVYGGTASVEQAITVTTLRVSGGTISKVGTGSFTSSNTSTAAGSFAYEMEFGVVATDLTGTGHMRKSGAGTLELTGTNTYSGKTRIEGGLLAIASIDSFSPNTYIEMAGGTLGGSGAFNLTTGTGSRNVSWSGTSGGFTAYGGDLTVTLNGGAALTWGVGDFNVATLVLNNSATHNLEWTNNLDLNGVQRGIQVNSSVAIISGVIENLTGTAGITKSGAGTLLLTGANTYNGTTTISGGTLAVQTAGVIPGGVVINNSAATLRLEPAGDVTLTNTIQITPNGATGYGDLGVIRSISGNNVLSGNIELTTGSNSTYNYYIGVDAGSLTISGQVSRAGDPAYARNLYKIGAGTLILNGQDRLVGAIGIYVVAGTLDLGGVDQAIGGAFTVGANATLANGTSITTPSFLYYIAGDHTLALNILGDGSFTKNSTGILELTGNNTYTGQTLIQGSGSAIRLRRSTDIGSGLINIYNAYASLRIDPAAGNLTLDNNFQFSSSECYGEASLGAIRNMSGDNIINGNIFISYTGNNSYNHYIGVDAGSSLTLNGVITRAGDVAYARTVWKVGTGTLYFGAADRLGNGVSLYINSGIVDFGGFAQNISGVLTVAASGAMQNCPSINAAGFLYYKTGDHALDVNITGTGYFTKNSTGVLELTGNNTFSGITTIQGSNSVILYRRSTDLGSGDIYVSSTTGTLRISPEAGNLTLDNNFRFTSSEMSGEAGTGVIHNLAGDNILNGNIYLSYTSSSGYNYYIGVTDGSLTLNGEISRYENAAARTIYKVGNGTMVLGAANRFVGTMSLYIAAGTVDFGGFAQTFGGTLTVAAAGNIINAPSVNAASFVYSKAGGTLTASITGGAFTYNGNGTLELTGNNTFVGVTTINGSNSVLLMRRATDIGTGDIYVSSTTSTFRINPEAANLTFANNFRFTSSEMTGEGATGVIHNVAGDNVIDGGIYLSYTSSSPYNYYIGVNADSSLTLNGELTRYNNAAARTIYKVGGGTLILGAENRFVGAIGLYIAAGTVDFGGYAQSIGGTLILTSTGNLINATSVTAGTLQLSLGAGNTDIGFNFVGGSLLKYDTGAVTMAGVNTYAGTTTITGGTLIIPASNAIGSGGVTINNGYATLALGSGASISNNITMTTNGGYGVGNLGFVRSITGINTISGNINISSTNANPYAYYIGTDADSTLQIAGTITRAAGGARTLYKVGAGTLEFTQAERIVGAFNLSITDGRVILPGNNTFSGGVTLTGGVLQINHENSVGSGAMTFSGVNTSVALYGDSTFSRSFSFATAALGYQSLGVIQSVSGSNTWNGNLAFTGTANIGVSEGATLTWGGLLSGLSGVRELYKIGTGTFKFGSDNRINTADSNITFFVGSGVGNNGGTVDLNGTSQTITNTVTFYQGSLINTAVGGSTLTTTGTFTMYAGSIGSNITISAPSYTFSPANSTDTISAAANLQGVGPLNKNGAGILTLTGTNTYSGATYINTGFLEAVQGVGLSTSSVIRFESTGQLVILGGGTFTRGLTTGLVGDNLVGWSAAGGGGFASKGGNLIVNLGGAMAQVTWGAGGFADTGELIFGSNVDAAANGTITFVNPMDLGNAVRTIRTRGYSGSNCTTMITGSITGSGPLGGLTKTGAGTLILTALNTYSGTTTINQGTLRAPLDSALPANSNLVFGGTGGYLETRGTMTRSIGRAAGDVAWDATNTSSGFGAVGGDLILNFGGAGAEVTWGAADFIPATSELVLGTTNSTGRVELQNDLNLGGDIRVIKVTDNVNSNDDFARITGAISNGSLDKTGTGMLELTGDSTYAGATRVIEGILKVNGTILSNVTVSSGATLKGSGHIGGGSINAGGIVAPGNSPGTITVDGDMTLFNGSIYEYEFAYGVPVVHDLTIVNGGLTLEAGWILKLLPVGYQKSEYDEAYELFTVSGAITFAQPVFDLSMIPSHWNTDDLLVYEQGGTVYLTHLEGEPVPEPATIGIIGLAMLCIYRKRRKA